MCRILVPNNNSTNVGQDKTILPHSVNENQELVRLAELAARLCTLEHSEGAKGGKKLKKKENEAKMKKQIYHIRK
jgi:hypothetical protein